MKWFQKTETLETRLFKSIMAGNKEEVRTMLGQGPDRNLTFYVVEWKNTIGLQSPSEIEKFHKGRRDNVRYDGTRATYSQRTPVELTNQLLRMTKNTVYKDILEDLVVFGYPAPDDYLREDLAKAVQRDDITAVEMLLRKKAKVNYQKDYIFPIHTAVMNGNLPIVKLLVEHSSEEVNRTTLIFHRELCTDPGDPLGFDSLPPSFATFAFGPYTLLMLAVESGNSELATYLIDNGADVNAKDCRGETVLMKAERQRMPEIVSLLKAKGAESVHRSDKDWHVNYLCAKELRKMWFPPIDPVEENLKRGNRLKAMSCYSAEYGVNYKEAKEAIDRIILYAANEGVSYKEAIQVIDRTLNHRKRWNYDMTEL